jgi:hypothetical protein
LDRRISAFIAAKRAENDISNQQEFCTALPDSARTDAAEIKRKQQIKHSKVTDDTGPLSTTSTSSSVKVAAGTLIQLPWGIEERLKTMEDHVCVLHPVPVDVYARIKFLEERILAMEEAGWNSSITNSSLPTTNPPTSSPSLVLNSTPLTTTATAPNGNEKRIAELVSILRHKSNSTNNNNTS